MKDKLIAFGIIVVLYALMILIPEFLINPFYSISSPQVVVIVKNETFLGKINFMPYGYDWVFSRLWYVIMLLATCYLHLKLRRKKVSALSISYLLISFIAVPCFFCFNSIAEAYLKGMIPDILVLILFTLFFQLWYFIFLLVNFIRRVRINIELRV
ncbi:MAG: hypothetical protein V4722_27005 [Bacteroidota bacterium]